MNECSSSITIGLKYDIHHLMRIIFLVPNQGSLRDQTNLRCDIEVVQINATQLQNWLENNILSIKDNKHE